MIGASPWRRDVPARRSDDDQVSMPSRSFGLFSKIVDFLENLRRMSFVFSKFTRLLENLAWFWKKYSDNNENISKMNNQSDTYSHPCI